MIYLIGDSQVRSFTFINEVVPLFLGPSKLINFNGKINAARTIVKAKEVARHLGSGDTVILFLGSGYRYSSEFSSNEEVNILNLAQFFGSCASKLKRLINANLVVLTPAAPTLYLKENFKNWAVFNDFLTEDLHKRHIENIDFSNFLRAGSPLEGSDCFDEIHLSTSLATKIASSFFDPPDLSIGTWRYEETISRSRYGAVKLNGNIAHHDLEISDCDTLCFEVISPDKSTIDTIIMEIVRRLRPHDSVICIEEGEGYLSRSLVRLGAKSVVAVFRQNHRMTKSIGLNRLCGFDIKSYSLQNFLKRDIKPSVPSVLIIDGFEKLRDEYKKDLSGFIEGSQQVFLITKLEDRAKRFLGNNLKLDFEVIVAGKGEFSKILLSKCAGSKKNWFKSFFGLQKK